jgi:imidazolonepropionase-like amidohydrolase
MIELLLANGVTSVRNMWGFPQTLAWKQEIDAGLKAGPRIYSTGPLTDGETYWKGSEIVTTPEEAEKSVVKVIADGYDYVKTYPSIPRDAFIKLMQTATEKGIKVIGHGNNFVTTDELIELGYYSIEHTGCLPKTDEEVLKTAHAGMWFCPTQAVMWTIHDYVTNDGDFSKLPYYEYVNALDRKAWDEITVWRKESPKRRKWDLPEAIRLAKLFIDNSDNVLLGSDTPNPGVIAGFSIHDELELMIRDFGLTPYQVLRTGTVNAARSLGILEHTGTVEVGKDADLLILSGNPLVYISHTRDLSAVIKAGQYYDRVALDAMLAAVLQLKPEEIVAVYTGV